VGVNEDGYETAEKGKVYLVGSGPGDPEMLTVRAVRLLETADVVLHDDLLPDEVLAPVPFPSCLHNDHVNLWRYLPQKV
jgi:siroheme synthase